jgi:hypothetical protein
MSIGAMVFLKIIRMHSAWGLLFFNPDFWDCLSKQEFCNLCLVCKGFLHGVPEREAIVCIFRHCVVKRVELVRVLPLTVHDVMKLRPPINFVDAFKIAERKTGGFTNCMAMVRERSLHARNEREKRRMGSVLTSLLEQGVSEPPFYDPFFRRALDCYVSRVVVWRYIHKSTEAMVRFQSDEVLNILRRAKGGWYKGIHSHMRDVMHTVDRMMRWPSTSEYLDVLLTGDVLMVGVLSSKAL